MGRGISPIREEGNEFSATPPHLPLGVAGVVGVCSAAVYGGKKSAMSACPNTFEYCRGCYVHVDCARMDTHTQTHTQTHTHTHTHTHTLTHTHTHTGTTGMGESGFRSAASRDSHPARSAYPASHGRDAITSMSRRYVSHCLVLSTLAFLGWCA